MLRVLRNPRLLGGVAIVAALVAVAFWPAAIEVDAATIQRGALEVTIDEEGETRVRERFVVSTPVSGRVLRIELEPGDMVAAGRTLMATIQPAAATPLDARARAEAMARVQAADAAVGRARAELQRARASRDLAAAEARRARALTDVISKQELDTREGQARIADEELKAAEFALRTAEQELRVARATLLPASGSASSEPITIRAPIEGVVLRRLRESESVVAAGEPLIELGNPGELEIVSDLLSTDAVKVKTGYPVRIEQWGGEGVLAGRVRRVEPAGFTKISALGVEEQRVNVVIDFEDPKAAWSALGDGYRVEVRIIVLRKENVLKAPTSSLFSLSRASASESKGRGNDRAVFVIEDGRARRRIVETGHRTGLQAEVESGLREGERVIVHPPDTIADGTRVTVRQP